MAYTYEKQLWKNYPDHTTPITADRLNHMEEGIFNAAKNGGGESDKIGVIKMFSGSTAPDGWLICDGSLISRTDYSGLFNVIGTSYNLETDTDDTKFRLPNLKGRVPVGLDSEDTDFNTLGKTGGEKTHTLTVDEMPSHTHKITRTGSVGSAGYNSWYNSNTESSEKMNLSSTGGGQPHNNLQPYIVLNYIIKASATTSTQGEIIDSLDGNSTTDAPSVHAVKKIFDKFEWLLVGKTTGTNKLQLPETFNELYVETNLNGVNVLFYVPKSTLSTTEKKFYNGYYFVSENLRAVAIKATTTQIYMSDAYSNAGSIINSSTMTVYYR